MRRFLFIFFLCRSRLRRGGLSASLPIEEWTLISSWICPRRPSWSSSTLGQGEGVCVFVYGGHLMLARTRMVHAMRGLGKWADGTSSMCMCRNPTKVFIQANVKSSEYLHYRVRSQNPSPHQCCYNSWVMAHNIRKIQI